MFERKRGDYLLPVRFSSGEFQFRGVIININPEGVVVVTNDRRFINVQNAALQDRDFLLEFNFFDLDTEGITASIKKIRPGLFKGYELVIDFAFTTIASVTKRDINRTIQAQRLN